MHMCAQECMPSCMYVYAYTHASRMDTELPAHTHMPGTPVYVCGHL